MIELLDELGYLGNLRTVTSGELSRPDNEFRWCPRGGAPTTLPPRISSPTGSHVRRNLSPSPGFCDPGIDAMIDRASRVQLEDPAAAGPLWAEIDRAIVDQAPYLWLVNPGDVEFVSERVGNYQFSPQWGSLLNQLWVR